MANILKNLNKFVLQFLSEYSDLENTDMEEKWMDNSVQTKVKNLLNKKQVCKDPNAPKRPKSSYLYFCSENRDLVVKELGNESKSTEITRALGIKWKELKENKSKRKELKHFEQLAEKDKQRYQDEMSSYKPSEEFASKKNKVDGPKRPKTSYLYFCEDNREKVLLDLGDNAKATNVTKELGLRWTLAKQNNEIEKYVKLAEKDKTNYFNMKKNKKEEDTEPENNAKIQKITHLNGYQKFCAERRDQVKEEFPKDKALDITKRLSVEWKNMSKDQQKSYSFVTST